MNFKNVIRSGLIILLCNCKNKAQENNINFDKVLKCSDYSYNDGYFLTADYGCLYNPNGNNKFGNLIIYLVPKKYLSLRDEDIAFETKKINNLSISEYKQSSYIFIYGIESQYLNYNKTGDPNYYQKEIYVEKLYTYDDKTNTWIFMDSVKVSNREEDIKEQKWRENFIGTQVKRTVNLVKNSLQKKWLGNYEAKYDYGQTNGFYSAFKLNIKVTEDSIIANGIGNQVSFKDLLKSREDNNNLILDNIANLDGEDIGKKMSPEFVLIDDNGNYYIKSKWIDNAEVVSKPQKLGYEIKKVAQNDN